MFNNHGYLWVHDNIALDKEILITSLGYHPNVGGLETHLTDLVQEIKRSKIKCHILTYQPITTNTGASYYENDNDITVIRLPKFGKLFYKFSKSPILEFAYLFPGIYFFIPILLLKHKNISTIHSHGLICGVASVFWAKVFNKKVITTTHSNYSFDKSSLITKISRMMFTHSDVVLCLSAFSKNEVVKLGVNANKVKIFTYWINLETFKPVDENQKNSLKWHGFNILFVGRLVKEKGIIELLESKKLLNKNIKIHFIGAGPLEEVIKKSGNYFHGKIDQEQIAKYYSASNIVVVPSTHDEGFGRVILESLACGTPVVASNRGGISEALDSSCGIKINISPQQIAKTINYLYDHSNELNKLKKNCRKYASMKYSSSNASIILNEY